MTKIRCFRGVLLTLVFVFLASSSSLAASDSSDRGVSVDQWLTLGPVSVPLPAFHDVENLHGNTFGMDQLAGFSFLDAQSIRPVDGELLRIDPRRQLRWQTRSSGDIISRNTTGDPSVSYAAVYLQANRWLDASLELKSRHRMVLYVGGERAASKTSQQDADADPGSLTHSLNVSSGKHLILVKLITDGETDAPLDLSGTITPAEGFSGDDFTLAFSPSRPLSLHDLTDSPTVTGTSVSPDGELTAVMKREARPGDNTWENWIELRRTSSGNLHTIYRGGTQISGMNWISSRKFSYTTRSGGKGTIWVVDLEDGSKKAVLRDVERLGGHQWSKDGSFFIYSVSEEAPANRDGIRKLDGMHDRYPNWQQRSFLYRMFPESGFRERLTAGKLTTSPGSISPNGGHLVFTRTHVDYSTRPFTRVEMLKMNLNTRETEVLVESPWIGGASYSPDGNSLLITGSPNAFDGAGSTIEDGLSNDYDTQAYIFDLGSRTPRSITRDLDPSVNSVAWSHDGRSVYLGTTDRSFNRVYRYDVRNSRHTLLDTGVDITAGFSVATDAPVAAYVGHGINDPHKAYTFDLRRDRYRKLTDPAENVYRDVNFGTSKDWIYTTEDGTEIDGHVYYPVNFDPSESWPVIVYYYGGTTPVTRAFSGRYPKELYAAKGYIVYVLQPSGAIGYGQEFSERHLNDWGIVVAGEIIESVGAFLDAHSYADSGRVGAMGASYGGFMTMLLLTKTDMFATAVSHAGISNITSYWGDGFWGYLYSSVASANSFPWDTPEIYVEQSPIFHADKVNTPLLLVTGDSDTNVPPGESMQFYTALKLLGKETALVHVEDQDHHIVDYGKFILWKNTIIAWFDKYLKDQPEWWENTY